MDWNSDLAQRAYIIVKKTAFEVVDSKQLGLKVVVVTDCIDETQKAIFTISKKQPFETANSFLGEERRKEVFKLLSTNWETLMEEYYV
ncbi:MAG: hypothetical protein FWG64_08740 [Firmicutes bacterium]|nr:hypothetical protein [Bacillota bacterium]